MLAILLPIGFVLLFIVVPSILLGLRIRTVFKPGPWTECPRCNYSLEGLVVGAPCPECGLANPVYIPRQVYRPAYTWSGATILGLSCAGFLMVLLFESTFSNALPNLWSSLRKLDPNRPFLHMNTLLTPINIRLPTFLVFGSWVGVFFACRSRGRIHLSFWQLTGLALMLALLIFGGFAAGFILAWYDNSNFHSVHGSGSMAARSWAAFLRSRS